MAEGGLSKGTLKLRPEGERGYVNGDGQERNQHMERIWGMKECMVLWELKESHGGWSLVREG